MKKVTERSVSNYYTIIGVMISPPLYLILIFMSYCQFSFLFIFDTLTVILI
jgi:hypothetical protein